ncbi:MAG: DUF1570 domain-containing protein [Pirellulales bacterium]
MIANFVFRSDSIQYNGVQCVDRIWPNKGRILQHPYSIFQWLLFLVALFTPLRAAAVERVVAMHNGQVRQLTGEAILEAADGGLLFSTDDGSLLPLPPRNIRSRSRDSEPLVPLDADALSQRLLAEMPPGFQIYQSTHYVLCYNTTRSYAKWCSSLLERLQRAFIGFWGKRGLELHPPKRPLVVIVFGDQASYARYAKRELGGAVGTAIGYYSMATNRIAMYDLTGVQALRRQGGRRGSSHDITALLSQSTALPLVATIVHEATPQVAFNCGMQIRYADNPVWVCEGLAMYFETPDLSSRSGWRGIGNVNYPRLKRLHQNAASGKMGSLRSLIANDRRIKTPSTAVDAYAEAWAWNYFLIRWRTKEYVAYLKMLADKGQLVWDDPATRLAEFREYFGEDVQALEADFKKRMGRLK